jgi:hypothetical protein
MASKLAHEFVDQRTGFMVDVTAAIRGHRGCRLQDSTVSKITARFPRKTIPNVRYGRRADGRGLGFS